MPVLSETDRLAKCDERLAFYRNALNAQNALPVLILGFTNAERPESVVLMKDDLPLVEVRNFVAKLLDQLDARLGLF